MLWIRQFKVEKAFLGERKIVHGHTPTPFPGIQQNLTDPSALVINIDGGCVYKHIPEFGHLTALNLDTLELHVLPNRD